MSNSSKNENENRKNISGAGNFGYFVKIKIMIFPIFLILKGILEFSPNLAGQDVTPINLDFSTKKNQIKKSAPVNNSFYSLAGKLTLTLDLDIQ